MRAIFCSIVIIALTLYLAPPALAEGQSANASDTFSETYPHITALENAILGQSFPGQPLTERLERMEKKAFGKGSTKPDLSDRTDDLDDYTEKTLHKNLLQATMDEETSDPMETGNSNAGLTSQSAHMDADQMQMGQMQTGQNQADYPHVTSLEQAILGQTYAGQPLADRLSRMEIKAFASASTNPDLGERTDALETYAEKKLHKKPLAAQNNDNGISAPQQSGGLLSKVGQAVLGMAGGSALNSMMGNSFGGLGPNFGGMGSSAMGPGSGFGGVNVRRRQPSDMQQEPPPLAPTHPEDPAVYQPTPPDPNAKLITKVGWCEVKVFGHTFPTMHLPERLGQLNHELKLAPGKSDIQLMDDIGLMIKAVQSRQQSVPLNQPNGQTKPLAN